MADNSDTSTDAVPNAVLLELTDTPFPAATPVTLNVGGTIISTSIETLTTGLPCAHTTLDRARGRAGARVASRAVVRCAAAT